MAIELSRHGARAPHNQDLNVSQTYWPEGLGMLTKVGKQQHIEVGQRLRSKYIDEYQFLSPNYNPLEILTISSYRERCKESAKAQLKGLYPDQVSYQIRNVDKITATDEEGLIDHKEHLNLQFYCENEKQQCNEIPINWVDEEEDYILRGYKACPISRQIASQIENTKEFKELQEWYSENLFKNLSLKSGIEIPKEWLPQSYVADELEACFYEGKKLNFEVTKSERKLIQQFLRDEFFMRKFGIKEASKIATNDLRAYISSHFNSKLQGLLPDLKFIILLGHDNTISSLLSAMGMSLDEHPIFASSLIFELWKDQQTYYVRLIYNEEELDLSQFCKGKGIYKEHFCEVERFIAQMTKYNYDLESICYI